MVMLVNSKLRRGLRWARRSAERGGGVKMEFEERCRDRKSEYHENRGRIFLMGARRGI